MMEKRKYAQRMKRTKSKGTLLLSPKGKGLKET